MGGNFSETWEGELISDNLQFIAEELGHILVIL